MKRWPWNWSLSDGPCNGLCSSKHSANSACALGSNEPDDLLILDQWCSRRVSRSSQVVRTASAMVATLLTSAIQVLGSLGHIIYSMQTARGSRFARFGG
jgi:hypothetical protein